MLEKILAFLDINSRLKDLENEKDPNVISTFFAVIAMFVGLFLWGVPIYLGVIFAPILGFVFKQLLDMFVFSLKFIKYYRDKLLSIGTESNSKSKKKKDVIKRPLELKNKNGYIITLFLLLYISILLWSFIGLYIFVIK